MTFTELNIRGCVLIQSDPFFDLRGSFTKIFHDDLFRQHGITLENAEQFFTVSNKDVLRGMHFQIPPDDHAKLVSCLSGKILDVLLDLRKDFGTYGQYLSLELDHKEGKVLYIPKGIAHGFLSLEDNSGVYYNTSSVHSPEHDMGIHWNSFGFEWPNNKPVISERDANHQDFNQFHSPF